MVTSPPPRQALPRWAWVAVLGLTVGLRTLWVTLVPSHPVGDFALYMESAEDLLEGGRLDDHFIYMPGWVLVLAAIKALGGGLLACKLAGVVAAGLGAVGVTLLAAEVGPWPTSLVAGLLYAIWPAGVAVSSVTGTDAPAGALIVLAVALLVRVTAQGRDRRAALWFGLTMGLAAWIRAVALPLAALAFFSFRAAGRRLALSLAWTGASVLVALVVLFPWALRNHARDGVFSFTDHHGGHTALVGSNPNTDGAYGRSLNRLFTDVTGYRLFDVPARHQKADQAAYAMAKSLARFEPAYTLGLAALKADRLLSHERNLLYWPLYRQGVLPERALAVAEAHRTALERLTDVFWYALTGLALAGFYLAIAGRRLDVVAWTLFPAALACLYVVFFAEVRYHLAVAPFFFPLAAATLVAFKEPATRRRALVGMVGAALSIGLAWPALLGWGSRLRDNHRFAATAVSIDDQVALALWRRSPDGPGPSPVRGTGNALGLQWAGPTPAGALAEIALPAGQWRLHLRAATSSAPGLVPDVPYSLWLDGQRLLEEPGAAPGETFTRTFAFPQYGTHRFLLRRDDGATRTTLPPSTLWFDDLRFLGEKAR